MNENNNEIDETKSKSPFFDFFKSIQPQQSQPNTARNLEGFFLVFLNRNNSPISFELI
jgi:hypothetical protein